VNVVKISPEAPFEGNVSINNLREFVPGLYTSTCRLSENLRRAGIGHTIVGGVAVSCHGFGRTTKNIDALVIGELAFEYRDGETFLRQGLPVSILGIAIHYVAPTDAFEKAMLEQYLTVPAPGEVPILPLGPLMVMKLIAGRWKDLSDVAELVKRHLREVAYLRAFIAENLPSQLSRFDGLVADAERELIEGGGV
jgi:hypothetical protein